MGTPFRRSRAFCILAGLALGASASACGEITAFCLSAGAGANAQVTTIPTPSGYRVVCGVAPPDTARSAVVAAPAARP